MKPLLLAGLISFVALPLALSQTPSSADNKTAEQEVRAAIEQYRTALMKRDTAALERIWADDYTFINASGTVLPRQSAWPTRNQALPTSAPSKVIRT